MTFSGFPPSALRLYEDLAADNSKEAWRLRHRERYERDVRAPMDELAAELSMHFKESAFAESPGSGGVRVLGPVRDTRMSHDKSPYKTYQGAYLDLLPCLGLWVHLDRHGLYASGRWYPYAGAEVARYRGGGGGRGRGGGRGVGAGRWWGGGVGDCGGEAQGLA
ncbi:DUF2461 family protein, partial [Streptomyces nojiriensis]|uniref:DUF2461 family protein n=1 Tax=Streptomyces nojiriensis TaxID=66374 RepID=UPI0035DC6FE6